LNKFKILNFQNLQITNAHIYNKPLEETSLKYEDTITIVIIRDPYEYFDYMMHHYVKYEMSPRLSKETLHAMKTLGNDTFLEWFHSLNYIPLVNPQTFKLDMRKRLKFALEKLELFDYVVPYDKLDIFLEKLPSKIQIEKIISKPFPFLFSTVKKNKLSKILIEKDLQLYKKAQDLWELTQANDFKSLKLLIEKEEAHKKEKKKKESYKGRVMQISENGAIGWVFHTEHPESVLVGLYKNGILLTKVKADLMRPAIKKNMGHPTGLCGFHIKVGNDILKSKDNIELKTLPDGILIPMGKQAKEFLGL